MPSSSEMSLAPVCSKSRARVDNKGSVPVRFYGKLLAEERTTRLNLSGAAGTCCWPTDLQHHTPAWIAGPKKAGKKERFKKLHTKAKDEEVDSLEKSEAY